MGGTGVQVRLVLEYCDKGTLREALDQGAFFSRELGLRACGSHGGAAALCAHARRPTPSGASSNRALCD